MGGDGWTMFGGWWDLHFGGGALVGSVRRCGCVCVYQRKEEEDDESKLVLQMEKREREKKRSQT